ncbi:hypothetical protein ACWEV4_32440, partial [Streptomyces sp. NPDC003860]
RTKSEEVWEWSGLGLDPLLDGYAPDTRYMDDDFSSDVERGHSDFEVLGEHHTKDNRHSYFLCHDTSATFNVPGVQEFIAFQITRDHDARTYFIREVRQPLVAKARAWLITRGCPPDALARAADVEPVAADAATGRQQHTAGGKAPLPQSSSGAERTKNTAGSPPLPPSPSPGTRPRTR